MTPPAIASMGAVLRLAGVCTLMMASLKRGPRKRLLYLCNPRLGWTSDSALAGSSLTNNNRSAAEKKEMKMGSVNDLCRKSLDVRRDDLRRNSVDDLQHDPGRYSIDDPRRNSVDTLHQPQQQQLRNSINRYSVDIQQKCSQQKCSDGVPRKSVETQGNSTSRAAAWAWYAHGGGKRIVAEGQPAAPPRRRSASSAASRFKLESQQGSKNEEAGVTVSVLFDAYELDSFERLLEGALHGAASSQDGVLRRSKSLSRGTRKCKLHRMLRKLW